MKGARPVGVTIVAVIAWVTGIVGILAGVLVLANPAGLPNATTAGWVQIAVGAITLAVSFGLFGGRNVARIIATAVFALNVGAGIYVGISHPSSIWSAVIYGGLALIGLVLLYTGRANEFFRR